MHQHPNQHLFTPWEPALQQIFSRYPQPSKIYCSGKAPSTVRQSLQKALRLFCSNPTLSTILPHDQALLLQRAFVFSEDPDGTIYVGPRRSHTPRGSVTIGSESAPTLAIPPIDCSNPTTLHAVLHLKNFDHLPVPLTIHNFTVPPTLPDHYPNVELIPNPDGSFTIL
jgi:hypothetical protein